MAFRAQNYLSFGGRFSWSFYLLLVILAVALGLRLNGVNWDQGYGFHPDERDIYMRSGCMYDLLTDAPNAKACGYLVDEPDARTFIISHSAGGQLIGLAPNCDRVDAVVMVATQSGYWKH